VKNSTRSSTQHEIDENFSTGRGDDWSLVDPAATCGLSNVDGATPVNRPAPRRTRVNDQIRARTVRLIGVDGKAVGVVRVDEALKYAEDAGVDLIEVVPTADPPVCKAYKYSKWRYEQDQKAKEKRKGHVELKEVKFRVRIGEGDYRTKMRKIVEILGEGDRVRLSIQLRGREIAHPELAQELLDRALSEAGEHGKLDGPVQAQGRMFAATLAPLRRDPK
jgi:translation initiation factor IF-3